MTLPNTPLLKMKAITSSGVGISKGALLKAAEAVPDLRVRPAGSKYGWYRRTVVMRVFGLNEESGKM